MEYLRGDAKMCAAQYKNLILIVGSSWMGSVRRLWLDLGHKSLLLILHHMAMIMVMYAMSCLPAKIRRKQECVANLQYYRVSFGFDKLWGIIHH